MKRHAALIVALPVSFGCQGTSDVPVNATPATPPARALPDAFPSSMKGYVLYAWKRAGQSWFTLATGTNRLKTFAELDDPTPEVGESGVVRVRVAGEDAARELMRRIPEGAFWMVQPVDAVSVAQDWGTENGLPEPVIEMPCGTHIAAGDFYGWYVQQPTSVNCEPRRSVRVGEPSGGDE